MGFASYIEDIQKRLDDDLQHFRQTLDGQPPSNANPWEIIAGHKRQLDGIYLKAQRILADIHRMLDLATDPRLDVAVEVVALRTEKAHLEGELRAARREMHMQQQVADQREAALRQQAALETQTRRDLEQKLRAYDVRLETDPQAFEAALAHFMPHAGDGSGTHQGGPIPRKKRRS